MLAKTTSMSLLVGAAYVAQAMEAAAPVNMPEETVKIYDLAAIPEGHAQAPVPGNQGGFRRLDDWSEIVTLTECLRATRFGVKLGDCQDDQQLFQLVDEQLIKREDGKDDMCLTNGALRLSFQPCSQENGGQHWRYEEDGTIRTEFTKRTIVLGEKCLKADGDDVKLVACEDGATTFDFAAAEVAETNRAIDAFRDPEGFKQDVQDTVQDKRQEVIEKAENIVTDAKQKVMEEIEEFLDEHPLIDALRDPEELMQAIRDKIREVKQEVKKEAKQYIRNLETQVKESLNGFIDQLEARITEGQEKAKEAIAEFRRELLQSVEEFFEARPLLDALRNPEAALDEIRSLIEDRIESFFDEHPFLDSLRNPDELRADIQERISNAADAIERKIEEVVDRVLNTKNEMVQAAEDKMDEMKGELTQFVQASHERAQNVVTDAKAQIEDIKNRIKEEIEDTIDGVKNKIVDARNKVTETRSRIEDEIVRVIEATKAEIMNRIDTYFNEHPLLDALRKPEEFMELLKDAITDKIEDLIEKYPIVELGIKVLREGKDSLSVKEKLQLSKAVAKILSPF